MAIVVVHQRLLKRENNNKRAGHLKKAPNLNETQS